MVWASAALVAGCGGGALGEGSGEEPAGQPVEPRHVSVRPEHVLAWSGGDLVIANGTTGAVESAVPGGTGERDVACDPYRSRAVVVLGGEDEGGEIVEWPVIQGPDGPRFGARVHRAWVDGRARVLPAPFGVVVFEESYGERWKLLAGAGAGPLASALAGAPVSAWISLETRRVWVHGLSVEEGAPRVTTAEVTEDAITLTSVGAPASPLSPGARLVPAPAFGSVISLDIEGSSLAVRVGEGSSEVVPLSSSSARIEGAAALAGGAVVAALLSTGELVAVALDPSGAVEEHDRLMLPDVVAASPGLSRSLAAQGDTRLFAATSGGVIAIDVSSSPLHLTPQPLFDGAALRGPLAVIDP